MSAISRLERSGGVTIGSRGSYEARARGDESGAEDLRQLERRGLLELVVAAVRRLLVRAPAQERGPVAEAITLEMVIGDLGHTLQAERLPRQVLAAVPAGRRPGEPLPGFLGCLRPLGPLRPRVTLQGVLPQRRELPGQCRALVPGEG